ncbi:hypothetical protein ACHAXA_003977 [Cyclostephanos tholiformis]|uniref:Uncharacterized protein n=1 Tax=Cyclostephanos tholiformis TaxID=382380 RepID=A0ABD3R415_9STRA
MNSRRGLLVAASSIIIIGGGGGWTDNRALAFAPPIPSDGLGSSTPSHHRRTSASSSSSTTTTTTTTTMTSSPDVNTRRRRMFLVDLSTLAALFRTRVIGHDRDVGNVLPPDQIATDTAGCDPRLDPKCIPKLTHDEALCKYGVVGATERTAACRRVRDAGGRLPNASRAGERSTMGWLNGDIALTK